MVYSGWPLGLVMYILNDEFDVSSRGIGLLHAGTVAVCNCPLAFSINPGQPSESMSGKGNTGSTRGCGVD